MTLLKTLIRWIISLFTKENAVTDTATSTQATTDETTATPVTAPTQDLTDRIKAMLIVLGHDVEAVWDELVSVAKKSL